MYRRGFAIWWAAVLGLCAAQTDVRATTNVSHRFVPALRPYSEELFHNLKVPPGFRINVFAQGQGDARMLLSLPNGTVLLTRHDVGKVVALIDRNGDGVADETPIVASIPQVHGLALRGNTVYLGAERELFTMSIEAGGGFGVPQPFADLPPGGLHPKRTLGFDDAGWLYVSIGSSCNNCNDAGSPEYATLVRMKPDGTERTVFASGLRNTIGFDWHPDTRQLWGMDNGSDDRGDTIPPEELNLLQEGHDYGWPSCYGRRRQDRLTRSDPSVPAKDCAKTTPMTRGYPAHSAPIAFLFYNGEQFPQRYHHDAFFAVHGSWNRLHPSGYKIVRIHFHHGRPIVFRDFVSGFLIEDGKAQFGRPAGLAVAQDGALLFSDDNNGMIFRVAYVGAVPHS